MIKIIILILLIAGIAVGVFLTQKQQIFKSRADIDLAPKELHFTNFSESSVTISWLTPSKQTSGFINFGTTASQLTETAYDTRGGQVTSKVHYVVLEKLKVQTTYYFKVVSNGKDFTHEKSNFSTPSSLSQPPSPSDPIFGKTSPNTIIYFYLQKDPSQPLGSTISQDNGTWTLDFSTLRPQGGQYYVADTKDGIILAASNGEKEVKHQAELGLREELIVLDFEKGVKIEKLSVDLNGDGVINTIDYIIKSKSTK